MKAGEKACPPDAYSPQATPGDGAAASPKPAGTQSDASVLKKVNPEIDQQAFVIIEEEVRAVMREALAGDVLNEQITSPIYHRHLSAADIQALVDFYKTPAGRRVLAALPVITEEGRRAGQAWGAELVPKMQARVLERLKTPNSWTNVDRPIS